MKIVTHTTKVGTVPYSYGLFHSVLGQQLFNFLLLGAAGYLGSNLSIVIAYLRIRPMVQQELHNI